MTVAKMWDFQSLLTTLLLKRHEPNEICKIIQALWAVSPLSDKNRLRPLQNLGRSPMRALRAVTAFITTGVILKAYLE